LSAADAAAHVIENPFTPSFFKHPIIVTLLLITLLGAIFLKGFKEAIGIAVILVLTYLLLNVAVIGRGLYEVLTHPHALPEWKAVLFRTYTSPLAMIGAALLVFPKLALGLSGFETGVAVMPLVEGDESDDETKPEGRVRNTRTLLRTAAMIMSVLLIASSFATTLLIPEQAFQDDGPANGRALAYLAHLYLGDIFGTAYDISTISILWFAGASAMAGLLNIVPRYLPRYGMAPNWTLVTRPLVLVYTTIAFAVTLIFKADVNAQGGAYATGVLVLMSSAAVAVTLSVWPKGAVRYVFLFISLVFIYTTIVNIIERPEGIKIASFFIGFIIITSFASRIYRSTELRVHKIEMDDEAKKIIDEVSKGKIRIIANRCQRGDTTEYRLKEEEQRISNHIPQEDPVVFLEVKVGDASEFSDTMTVNGVHVEGYRVLRACSSTVPNAIAAFLLDLRDKTGKIPHAYFSWSEGNPLIYMLKYVLLGEGDTAPVTHEVLRQAEEDPERRPAIHVGG
jgi:hypothetical protein